MGQKLPDRHQHISEVRKGTRCDTNVARWYASLASEAIYLSVLVVGEIRKGIEQARPRDPGKALALEHWLQAVYERFSGRILPIDPMIACPAVLGRQSEVDL